MSEEQQNLVEKSRTNWFNLPEGFWEDWNKTCSEINDYFKKVKSEHERKMSGKVPRYRDSHSLYY